MMSPLWRDETPASFTPDVMQSVIRSPIAFLTDVNVTTCFQHRLFNITEASVAGSLYSAHQHAPERIIVRPFPYRSPQGMFPSLAA